MDDWKRDLLRRTHDHLLDAQLILNELNNGYPDQFLVLRNKIVDIRMVVGVEILAEAADRLKESLTPAEKKRQAKSMRKVDRLWKMTREEMALVKDGKPISAIKSIRDRKNMGLMDAKVVVDRYRDHMLKGKN